jgi:hypothetical protein
MAVAKTKASMVADKLVAYAVALLGQQECYWGVRAVAGVDRWARYCQGRRAVVIDAT